LQNHIRARQFPYFVIVYDQEYRSPSSHNHLQALITNSIKRQYYKHAVEMKSDRIIFKILMIAGTMTSAIAMSTSQAAAAEEVVEV
jgi:hypothetical protein